MKKILCFVLFLLILNSNIFAKEYSWKKIHKQINTFKEKAFQVKKGMSKEKVFSILGKSDSVNAESDTKIGLLDFNKNKEILRYWWPEMASVRFLVIFEKGRVTDSVVVQAGMGRESALYKNIEDFFNWKLESDIKVYTIYQ